MSETCEFSIGRELGPGYLRASLQKLLRASTDYPTTKHRLPCWRGARNNLPVFQHALDILAAVNTSQRSRSQLDHGQPTTLSHTSRFLIPRWNCKSRPTYAPFTKCHAVPESLQLGSAFAQNISSHSLQSWQDRRILEHPIICMQELPEAEDSILESQRQRSL